MNRTAVITQVSASPTENSGSETEPQSHSKAKQEIQASGPLISKSLDPSRPGDPRRGVTLMSSYLRLKVMAEEGLSCDPLADTFPALERMNVLILKEEIGHTPPKKKSSQKLKYISEKNLNSKK